MPKKRTNVTEKNIENALERRKPKHKRMATQFLSTGSTMLNLACTGKARYGFGKGKYYFLVGDSDSGKTFLSLTCLAEASINKNFDNYRMIYDNAEDGALMNIRKFFGKAVKERMEPPEVGDDDEPIYSDSLESFYYHITEAFEKGIPFIYILDSMDSLTTEQETSKFEERMDAFRKGKETSGSYGDGKAKLNAANLRRQLAPLRDTGSILIVINQTRDNIAGFGFKKKTRSGGHALKYYATIEIWTKPIGKIKKQIKGKKRSVGTNVQLKVERTRWTGLDRPVTVAIYPSYGIDDIGSMVDYLIEEKHWSRSGKTIKAKEFKKKVSRDKLIRYIEKKGYERKLQKIVEGVWNDIEQACEIKRKPRY
jgi:RecA/RadA recombinase